MKLIPGASRFALILLLCTVHLGSDCLLSDGYGDEATENSKHRRYALGPLDIKEFAGDAKVGESRAAFTATRIQCQFKCSVRKERRDFVATLTTLNAFATFLPNSSWWCGDDDLDLLDHEQGHFDIAEINARKLELSFTKLLTNGQIVVATGTSAVLANRALAKKLDQVIQHADRQVDRDNLEYDRTTRHGWNSVEQHERRRIQQLTLPRLSAEIKALRPKGAERDRNSVRSRR